MWNLDSEAAICLEQTKKLGIQTGEITGFYVKHKLYGKWGMCRILENGKFEIYINGRLLAGDIPIMSLRTTIVHEILHTSPGCFNHGRLWRSMAKRMNEAYGYTITRATTERDKGIRDKTEKIIVAEKIPPERRLRLQAGNYIEHKALGPGLVLEVQPIGNDALVTIAFQDGSTKRFMQSLATVSITLVDQEREAEHHRK